MNCIVPMNCAVPMNGHLTVLRCESCDRYTQPITRIIGAIFNCVKISIRTTYYYAGIVTQTNPLFLGIDRNAARTELGFTPREVEGVHQRRVGGRQPTVPGDKPRH